MEGEEGSVNTRFTPYETTKPVTSSVQTVMFSNTKRENLSEILESYQNLAKQQSRDLGGGYFTIKMKHS
jgi:hypothetical protein